VTVSRCYPVATEADWAVRVSQRRAGAVLAICEMTRTTRRRQGKHKGGVGTIRGGRTTERLEVRVLR